jgi:hypothetical protein
MDDMTRRVVEAWPPLTPQQKARVSGILYPRATPLPADAFETEDERQARLEVKRRERRAQRIADIVTTCRACGIPRNFHEEGPTKHSWEPLTDQELAEALAKGANG